MYKLSGEWEDPSSKNSHPSKPLATHIKEVKSYLETLLDFYDLESWQSREAGKFLAEYHDIGKLHIKWNLSSDKRLSHSYLSYKWILENNAKFESRSDLSPVLWYLVLKHHSNLSSKVHVISGFDCMRSQIEGLEGYVGRCLKRLSLKEKLELVDTFGLFKIADICSAGSYDLVLERPKPSECDVRKLIGQKLSEKRWIEQLALKSLPQVALLRAYTGWGKTTAALLYFVNKNVNKVFYLLPTITAINKFSNKLENIFGDKVERYFYFYDVDIVDDFTKIDYMFFVKNFIGYPYVVTTVDQFLLSFLQVGKYHFRRVAFRGAGIIVDEVHLLNPLILNLLTYFVQKYRTLYNFRILLMSATLPLSLKKYLSEELSLSNEAFLDYSDGYRNMRRVKFEYYNRKYIDECVVEAIDEFVNGKKVLIITNTVEKSRELAKELSSKVGKDKVILLHARFMYGDRRTKESQIDRYNEEKRSHILISTQVSEVSLDISYDSLYTELAPLPSLIQRFGRVNRYGKHAEETNVKIFKPSVKNEEHYPYCSDDLKAALEVVEELMGDRLKTEMDLLMEFDRIYSYERFMNELQNELGRINLDKFEEILSFFYSLPVQEQEFRSLLEYRDSLTTLVIPSPDCIIDDKLIQRVSSLLDALRQSIENQSLKEQRRRLIELKEVVVPVPIWWCKEGMEKILSFPIVKFKDKKYDRYFGLG